MRLSHLLLIGIVAAVVGCTGPDTPTLDSADTPALNSSDTTAPGSADTTAPDSADATAPDSADATAPDSTDATAPDSADATVADDKEEPDAITVQHCLIGFSGSVRGKSIKRSKMRRVSLLRNCLKSCKRGGTSTRSLQPIPMIRLPEFTKWPTRVCRPIDDPRFTQETAWFQRLAMSASN